MTETKVHHQTERGARISLAKKQISRASYEAILAGTLTLAEAKELGREGGTEARTIRSGQDESTDRPQQTSAVHIEAGPRLTSRISKDDATQECWCGCGERTKPHRRWKPGHDQRAKGIIKRAVATGKADELLNRLRDYGQERGLI